MRIDQQKAAGGYHFLVTDAATDLSDGFTLAIDSAGRPVFTVASSATTRATAQSSLALTPNTTYHLVGTLRRPDRTRLRRRRPARQRRLHRRHRLRGRPRPPARPPGLGHQPRHALPRRPPRRGRRLLHRAQRRHGRGAQRRVAADSPLNALSGSQSKHDGGRSERGVPLARERARTPSGAARGAAQ